MRDINNMTFSALHRYAVIVESVLNSDAFLSTSDRIDLINELLDDSAIHTKSAVDAACVARQELTIGQNMTDAQIVRDAHRGY